MTHGKHHSMKLQETTQVIVSANAGICLKMLAGSNVNIAGDFMRDVVMRKNSATMEYIKSELSNENIEQCPTCGGPVVIKGKITKYFVPVDAKILKEIGIKFKS